MKTQTRWILAVWVTALLFAGAVGCVSTTATKEMVSAPAEKPTVASVSLATPASAEERDYLGIAPGERFRVSDIKGRVLILEIYDMYCPYCQKEAPEVNDLFRMIEGRADLKGKIKIVGIGWGNSPFEVKTFRHKYGVLFPLFPDKDESISKMLEAVQTPTFIIYRMNGDGSFTELFREYQKLGKPSEFLGKVLTESGLKQEESS